MLMTSHRLQISTRGKGLYEFTHQIANWLAGTKVRSGLLTVFVQHTSASLTIQENADPDVVHDLNTFFNRLVPEDNRLYRHTCEGPDDMPAHIRAALTLTQAFDPGGGRARWRSAPGRASTSSNTVPSPTAATSCFT